MKLTNITHSSYLQAWEIAQEHLSSNDPLKLELGLTISKFYYDGVGDKEKALEFAKHLFDDGNLILKFHN